VIELRLHRELYRGTAVDEAVKVFVRYGVFELAEAPEHWVVRVQSKSIARERQLAGELGNYALGLTVKQETGT
jgi:hypothetical protein